MPKVTKAKFTKALAPNTDGLYLVYIDGKPNGYPITEEAANAKIERLSKPSNDADNSDEYTL